MTTIERMAETIDAELLKQTNGLRYIDQERVAKAALAALLPLDEGALKDARAKFEDARRLGWLRSGCGRGAGLALQRRRTRNTIT